MFRPVVTSARRHRLPELAFVAVLALAAVNYLWQLGSSSLYVDEVQSVTAAVAPLKGILHLVQTTEITPPTYFWFLHGWLALADSQADWVARLPSAVGGILLTAAVLWLGSLVLRTRAAVIFAGVLCACSPFVLEHAQRAQGYVFVALGAAVAVAAVLEAERGTAPGRWFVLSLAASVVSLAVHYTAALVVGPLCLWVLTREAFPRGWKLAFSGACLGTEAALVPLLVEQHREFPQRSGVLGSAVVTPSTLASMLEVPFSGRVSPLRLLGLVVTAGGLASAAAEQIRLRALRDGRSLVVALAIFAPLALIALSALSGHAFWGHLMLTRYAAASAPFIIVALAAGLEALPRIPALVLGLAALALALTGTLQSHRAQGFFFNARGIVAYLRQHVTAADAVVAPPSSAAAVPLLHYGLGSLRPRYAGAANTSALIQQRTRRLWLVVAFPAGSSPSRAEVVGYARSALPGYDAVSSRVFPASTPGAVLLARPSGR